MAGYHFSKNANLNSQLILSTCLWCAGGKATSRWPDQEENPFGDEASTSPKKNFPALESGGTSLEVVFGVQRWSFIIIADDVIHSLTDNWGSVDCSMNWIGITTGLAMCWGTWIGTAVVLGGFKYFREPFDNLLLLFDIAFDS